MVLETHPLTQTMANSWQSPRLLLACLALAAACAQPLLAQTTPQTPQNPSPAPPSITETPNAPPIGRTRAAEVQVTGDVRLRNGEMQLGNGSTITAGTEAIPITLTRGGELRLCATTSVHLARDRSIAAPDASGLMLGLDRGAIEAHYQTGKYSDVLLTPDLRILISGPGEADISIRVSRQGDTCVDNRGANAPYITVSSQLEGGLYRVQPGQHVSFQHGSLREVVDTEHEPCGCPTPPLSVADAGTPSTHAAAPGRPVGGPSSTPADTEFPLATSEGLTPPPPQPTAPVAAPGEVHAQVAVPFSYNAKAPAASNPAAANGASTPGEPTAPATPAPSSAAPAPVPSNMQPAPAPAQVTTPAAPPPSAVAVAPPAPVKAPHSAQPSRNILHRVGHFFSKLFGAESQ